MGKIVIGIDPDSQAHGCAFYVDGELKRLMSLQSTDLISLINIKYRGAVLSIENVMANQFVYARNRHGSTANQSKIAMHIGRCQQAQVELMRWLDHYQIPYVLHKPSRLNWAKDKDKFQRITGWKGKSNEDTRSAAYFGWLER